MILSFPLCVTDHYFDFLMQALELFRKEQVDFLIATDVAARVRTHFEIQLCFLSYIYS